MIKVSLCQFFVSKFNIPWFSLQIHSQTNILWWLTRHSIHASKMELYSQSPLWVKIGYSRLYQVSGYFHDASNSGENTFPRKTDSIMKMKSKNSQSLVPLQWSFSGLYGSWFKIIFLPQLLNQCIFYNSTFPAVFLFFLLFTLTQTSFFPKIWNHSLFYHSSTFSLFLQRSPPNGMIFEK